VPVEYVTKQAMNLYRMLEANACVFLTGSRFSGKSAIPRALAVVLDNEQLKSSGAPGLRPMRVEHLIPAARCTMTRRSARRGGTRSARRGCGRCSSGTGHRRA
jgi:hypothetical protein